MKIVFFDFDKSVVNALLQESNKYNNAIFKNVEFIHNDLTELVANYNNYILVSPANSFGSMGGGIDYYINYRVFKGIQKNVQTEINKRDNQFPESIIFDNMDTKDKSFLPVGECFIIPADSKNYLAVTPTMEYPRNVENTNNAYIAMSALLKQVDNVDAKYLLVPGFCSGIGSMKPQDMAEQMIKALVEHYS
jgi:O-acetyl-ADP-ribose deacetylase (regulator of RNase III)